MKIETGGITVDVAEKMLKSARLGVLEHFEKARLSKKKESTWKRGLLATKDINKIELGGDAVKIKIEDGYFYYKIIFKTKNK
jgi:hypothetical protein